MVQLARFFFDKKTQTPGKITTGATYQQQLTLPFETNGDVVHVNYTLQAIIDHEGRDTASGHYIAYARRLDAGKGTTSKPHNTVQWFKFNDSVVDLVDEDEVFVAIHTDAKTGAVRTPYILLYQRESD
jgi:ubiquitin C-terminal hydrolase